MRAFLSASSLYLVPFESTHHLRNSSTLIDLCIIDDNEKLREHGQHDVPFLSAHDLIFIRYGVRVERKCVRMVTCRDWREFNAARFQTEVEEMDWTDLIATNNLDEKIKIFN